jgi:hypothetical protein
MADCESDCLHCAINKLVQERAAKCLKSGEVINLPAWAEAMAQSLADLIVVAAPSEERTRMLVHTTEYLNRLALAEERTRH